MTGINTCALSDQVAHCLTSLKTGLREAALNPSSPSPSNHHFPPRLRTLYTLLDSYVVQSRFYTINALPPATPPSLLPSLARDSALERWLTCERLNFSLLSSSLPRQCSPRITVRSSLRPKSLVRIIIVIVLSLKYVLSQTRTRNARHILTRSLLRTLPISPQYGSLRLSSRATLPVKRSGQKLRLAFRISHLKASLMEVPSM
jgi:hypothetical protein